MKPTIHALAVEIINAVNAIHAQAPTLSDAARDATVNAMQRALTMLQAGQTLIEPEKEETEEP